MKEFVEKLIARLEEKALEHGTNGRQFSADGYDKCALDEFIERLACCKAIEIVNQLAEEYNNGWIPCSERLPKEENDYLVTQYNKNAIDEYCNGSRISKIFFDVEWWDDIDHECGWDIIAWQPLPEPHKKE